MGVVRIDDKLQKEIQRFLSKDENKYKHPSMAAFINYIMSQELKKMEKENDK